MLNHRWTPVHRGRTNKRERIGFLAQEPRFRVPVQEFLVVGSVEGTRPRTSTILPTWSKVGPDKYQPPGPGDRGPGVEGEDHSRP